MKTKETYYLELDTRSGARLFAAQTTPSPEEQWNLTAFLMAGLLVAIFCEPLFARDLGGAATSAVNLAKNIARVLSVFGLVVGGILMQLPGLSDFGRRTMGAGIIGCLCAFGGPALVSFFQGVFGGT